MDMPVWAPTRRRNAGHRNHVSELKGPEAFNGAVNIRRHSKVIWQVLQRAER